VPVLNRFSASDISGPPLARALKEQHWRDVKQDASDMLKMLLGTAWHALMEKSANGAMVETRLEMPWDNGYTISGIADLYFPAEQLLVDHKTASTFAFILDKGAKREWITQLNIYKKMLLQAGHKVNKMQVWGLATDWSAGKAMGGNGYPEIPFSIVDVPSVDIAPIIDAWIQRYLDECPCTPEERWTRPTQYAVSKQGRKSALRVLDTMEDAEEWASKNTQPGLWIDVREGKAARCESYCTVAEFCPHRG
jgi:hypothetical protein